jgi:hypothetical protein
MSEGENLEIVRGIYERWAPVWTLRGGAVIRIESVKEREEALEAVGRRD